MNRFNSISDDYYINMNLNTEMDLQQSRETVSRGRTGGGRRKALTMSRIARGFPPTRRIARTIFMGHYQRSLVLARLGGAKDMEITRAGAVTSAFSPPTSNGNAGARPLHSANPDA